MELLTFILLMTILFIVLGVLIWGGTTDWRFGPILYTCVKSTERATCVQHQDGGMGLEQCKNSCKPVAVLPPPPLPPPPKPSPPPPPQLVIVVTKTIKCANGQTISCIEGDPNCIDKSPTLCAEKSYRWCKDKDNKCVRTKDTSKYHINNCFTREDDCEKEESYCYIYDKYYNNCVKYSGYPEDTIHIKDKDGRQYDIKCHTWDKCNKYKHDWPRTKTGKCCTKLDSNGKIIESCINIDVTQDPSGVEGCNTTADCLTNYNILPGEKAECCDIKALDTYGTCSLPRPSISRPPIQNVNQEYYCKC